MSVHGSVLGWWCVPMKPDARCLYRTWWDLCSQYTIHLSAGHSLPKACDVLHLTTTCCCSMLLPFWHPITANFCPLCTAAEGGYDWPGD